MGICEANGALRKIAGDMDGWSKESCCAFPCAADESFAIASNIKKQTGMMHGVADIHSELPHGTIYTQQDYNACQQRVKDRAGRLVVDKLGIHKHLNNCEVAKNYAELGHLGVQKGFFKCTPSAKVTTCSLEFDSDVKCPGELEVNSANANRKIDKDSCINPTMDSGCVRLCCKVNDYINRWVQGYTTSTYTRAKKECQKDGGRRLCTRAEICPDGHTGGERPDGGKFHRDMWVPTSDWKDAWVQTGTGWPTCLLHSEIDGGKHGNPSWSEEVGGEHGKTFRGRICCRKDPRDLKEAKDQARRLQSERDSEAHRLWIHAEDNRLG